MKKIFLILLIVMGLLSNISAQSKHKRTFLSRDSKIGVSVTFGGAAFVVAGLLTSPEYHYVDNYWKPKPFMEQGARSLCIVSGVTLTVTGIITMLAGY